jgi:hypothetical protein
VRFVAPLGHQVTPIDFTRAKKFKIFLENSGTPGRKISNKISVSSKIFSRIIFHNLFTALHRIFLSHDRTPDFSLEQEEACSRSGFPEGRDDGGAVGGGCESRGFDHQTLAR